MDGMMKYKKVSAYALVLSILLTAVTACSGTVEDDFASLETQDAAVPESASLQPDEQETEESSHALISRSKRDYCCIFTDYVGRNSCRKIRDYRDELGRLSARNNCQGNPFVGTSWEQYTLVSASCSDRPECPPEPPPVPTCSNGAKEGATWTALSPGTRCVEVRYACTNLQIVELGSSVRRPCTEL